MSLSTNEVIKCPDCGASYTFTCHPSINAQTDPHLREAVLSGEAFTSRCPKCSKTIQVVYPCLYQSPKQGFMIYFLPGYEQRVLKVDGEMEQLFESREASTRRVVDSYRGCATRYCSWRTASTTMPWSCSRPIRPSPSRPAPTGRTRPRRYASVVSPGTGKY